GRSTFGRNDVQPNCRPRDRRSESANRESRTTERQIECRLRVGLSVRIDRGVSTCGVFAELAYVCAIARSSAFYPGLQLRKTLYGPCPFHSRSGTRDLAVGCVDRGS